MAQLMATPGVLREILENHVLAGRRVSSGEFVRGASFPTLNPSRALVVAADVGPALEERDMRACASAVHAFGAVIAPQQVLPLVARLGVAAAAGGARRLLRAALGW
jgi:hypothetical protein